MDAPHFVEEFESEPALPPWYRGLAPWLIGVAAGAMLIAFGAAYEAATAVESPLDGAVILIHDDTDAAIPEGVTAAAGQGDALPVTIYSLPRDDDALPDDGSPAEVFANLFPRVRLVTLDGEAAEALSTLLAPMVTQGVAPQPGDSELLAGPGAALDELVFGGEHYAVSGRLGHDAGIFYGVYIALGALPSAAIADTHETRAGYLFLDRQSLRDALPDDDGDGFTLSTGMHFAPGVTIGLAIFGLFVVAVSGSVAWIRLFQNLAGRGGFLLRPAFNACRDEAALLVRAHAILYGVFFSMMALGLIFTDTYAAVLAYVQEIFTTGDLQQIGEAYESGNILAAKFQTWRHNYLVATVLLSALPSLLIPGAALIKNALSFALIGFVMVPVLAGTAFVMSFHSITMWLELEAYILVSFAAILIPVRVMRAFAEPGGDPGKAYLQAAGVLGSMTLIAGGILLVAALYEASTLILLR